MDKTGIIVVSICAALLVWWFVEETKIAHQQAEAAAAQAQAAALQAQITATNAPVVTGTNLTGTATVTTPATPAPAMTFDTNMPEQTIVLTNADARYTFTSRGGGLKLIELLKYPETISARWKGEVHNSSTVAALNDHAPLPVMAVIGDRNLIGDGNFTLTRTGNGGVRAEKAFANGLVLTKDFQLSSNYLVNARVDWKNTSDQAVTLPQQQFVVGTATPMDADDTSQIWGAMWYDGTNNFPNPTIYFNTNTAGLFGLMHRTPTPDYVGGNSDVVWAAVHNQFYALMAMPAERAWKTMEIPVTLPRFQDDGTAMNVIAPQGVQATLVYPGTTLTANGSQARSFTIYAGPKEFRTLSHIGEQYDNHADLVMNFGSGFGSFWGIGTFFAKVLLSAMNALHDLTHIGYGWLIVIITILIRTVFWPLTAVSLRSSKKMQALAPEIAALKEKYKDDNAKFAEKQMELWKKNGVNPMSGCLPMLVQMPVFMGFYTMLRSAIELRGASFLWAADLSKPDTLFMIPGVTFIPVLSTPDGLPFNLLPLLMVGAMIWQAHLQPASPGMDASQQKMMRYIPLMFLLIFYNYSSGMALYMMVSTMAGILQTKLTKINMSKTATPALTKAQKYKK
jgi:YidC/Oxa1 family membrane protein insertase